MTDSPWNIGTSGAILAGCVFCGLGLLYSYQPGFPAAKEARRVAAIPEQAGGTPEDKLWDVNPGLGSHWYYVRLEQQDGQLAGPVRSGFGISKPCR